LECTSPRALWHPNGQAILRNHSSVGACLFDSRQVQAGADSSGGTPPELAAEDGCATGLEEEKPARLDQFMVRERVPTEQEALFGRNSRGAPNGGIPFRPATLLIACAQLKLTD
jgi:hypothetical protein